MNEEKRALTVNCGLACLLEDKQGMLDGYETVKINCGTAIISREMNALLAAKSAVINSGDLRVCDIKGEIIQLDKTVIDGAADLKGLFVIAKDDLIVRPDGVKAIAEAEGVIALGTIYYPESAKLSSLIKVSGEKKPYPDDAQVVLGDHKLESLISMAKAKHIWVSGRITVLDKKAMEKAKEMGLIFTAAKLFTYEGLDETYGSLFNCPDRTLVPDGHEVTGKINAAELPLYGKKIYVDGNFMMEEKDIPALEEIESIIVRGKASLPSSAVKIFKEKGKAEKYFVFEGRFVEINGSQQFSHSQLAALVEKGEKITLQVNGGLIFDDDVTAEDAECIASLSYNGSVLVSDKVKAALASKVKTGNGFMGDPAKMEELTGHSIKDLAGNSKKEEKGKTTFNMGTYILS
jgi:hypothetical protein